MLRLHTLSEQRKRKSSVVIARAEIEFEDEGVYGFTHARPGWRPRTSRRRETESHGQLNALQYLSSDVWPIPKTSGLPHPVSFLSLAQRRSAWSYPRIVLQSGLDSRRRTSASASQGNQLNALADGDVLSRLSTQRSRLTKPNRAQ